MENILTPERVLPLFEAEMKTVRGRALGGAFCLLEACQRSQLSDGFETRMATFEEIKTIVEAMTCAEAIILRSLPVAEEILQVAISDLGSEDQWIGSVLIFEDLTALWFRTSQVSSDELCLEDTNLQFPRLMPRDSTTQVIAISPAFLNRYGNAETWRAGLPEDPSEYGEDDIDTVIPVALEDLVDPPIESVDLREEKSWSAEDETRIEETIELAWYSLKTEHGIEIDITSAGENCDHEKTMSLTSLPEAPDCDAVNLLALFDKLISTLIDFNSYRSQAWEYNDGPADRLSGYYPFAMSLVSCEIDPQSPSASNHKKIGARHTISAELEKRGWKRTDIDAFFAEVDAAAKPQHAA